MKVSHIIIVFSIVVLVAAVGAVVLVTRSSAETSAAEQQVAELEKRVAELETAEEEASASSDLRVKFTTDTIFEGCSFFDEDTSAFVNDGTGLPLSTVRLGTPTIVYDDGLLGTCTFRFVFPDVPTDEAIYTINIGEKDIRSYSNRELAGSWLVLIDMTK